MWKDILGHGPEIEDLKSSIVNGRVPHAYIFAGPEGLGKTRIAKEFFKALNCLNTPGDPCDSCRSCLKAIHEGHPDFRTLGPRNGQIVIEDVRGVIDETSLKPFDARRRLIVIEPAERLNKASANALLKTLEEPPESSVIILVSHKPSLLLPTLVSRCQVVRFSPLDASVKNASDIDPVILRSPPGPWEVSPRERRTTIRRPAPESSRCSGELPRCSWPADTSRRESRPPMRCRSFSSSLSRL